MKCDFNWVLDGVKTPCENTGTMFKLHDGGYVSLCDKHASWSSALGKA